MKLISSRAQSLPVLRKITLDCGSDALFASPPEYSCSPSAVETSGTLLAIKESGRWQPVASALFIDNIRALDELAGDLDSVPEAISSTPRRVTNEQDPHRKAVIAHNLGMYLHECEAWGVDRSISDSLVSQFGSKPIPTRPDVRGVPRQSATADATIVGPGSMTYSDWKGTTGPGANFRLILAAANKKRFSPDM